MDFLSNLVKGAVLGFRGFKSPRTTQTFSKEEVRLDFSLLNLG